MKECLIVGEYVRNKITKEISEVIALDKTGDEFFYLRSKTSSLLNETYMDRPIQHPYMFVYVKDFVVLENYSPKDKQKEDKPKEEPQVKAIKRCAKVGEYVRFTRKTWAFNEGQIVKCVYIDNDHKESIRAFLKIPQVTIIPGVFAKLLIIM